MSYIIPLIIICISIASGITIGILIPFPYSLPILLGFGALIIFKSHEVIQELKKYESEERYDF